MQQVAPISPPNWNAQTAALFAGLLVVDSFHYIFARLLLPHLHPTASAFFVLAVGTAEVALFAGAQRQLHWRPFRTYFWFFAAIGFLIASSTVLSYLSIAYIDPGVAAMLGKSGVIISLLLSLVWLRERLNRVQAIGAAFAVLGAITISFHPGAAMQWGALLILLSTFLYALHAAIVKRWGGAMAFLDFFVFRLLFTSAFLFCFAVGGGHLRWPDAPTWLLLVLTGTVDVVISRALYYQTLRLLPMSIHTIILTLSPVVAIGASLLLFGEFPGAQDLIGGGMVLAGVFVVSRAR
ncbi:DMT family transporter [Caldilinea sp.]|uniref:DMT family transporter n=1 Tax=Caldilinea sp. TaxID=2293560 RepID=UPI002BDBC30F|nr:DMT family transporter [Caldilinea sp.]HRA64780.1 DMT family transporter [Caldilinea sp.]